MCGILGGNNPSWDYNKGILALKHRGPDGQRVVKFDDFTMAFARLAIIDLSDNGMQPMISINEDVCIVFNGEIYGYHKLRMELIKKGHAFKSESDTEVILNAYFEYNDDFINHIDGMFAIAIYDLRTYKIKLFRDRVGIKPLYYFYDGENFGFSSELKGITTMCNNYKFEVDYTALYDYLTYTYIPEPKTVYKNVFKMSPAEMLVFDIKKKKIRKRKKYWTLSVNCTKDSKRSAKDVEEEVRYLIKKSVQEQIVADVPVGSFLSGGIDSSVVSTEVFLQNKDIEAFSMGFSDKKFDETEFAKILCDRYPININIGLLKKDDFKHLYKDFTNWYDEPYADTSGFPTYMVSKMAREKVTVVLTGDGGDEVFGGYRSYPLFVEKMKNRKLNNKLVSDFYEKVLANMDVFGEKVEELFTEDIIKFAKISGYLRASEKKAYKKMWNIDNDYDDFWYFRKFYNPELPSMTRVQYLDFKTYLPSDILTKVDRATMQVSLEARVPILSKEIVEFSFSLSEDDRCPKGVLKGLIKDAYNDIIPKEILYRRKMGFSIPDNYMYTGLSRQEELLKRVWKY